MKYAIRYAISGTVAATVEAVSESDAWTVFARKAGGVQRKNYVITKEEV